MIKPNYLIIESFLYYLFINIVIKIPLWEEQTS